MNIKTLNKRIANLEATVPTPAQVDFRDMTQEEQEMAVQNEITQVSEQNTAVRRIMEDMKIKYSNTWGRECARELYRVGIIRL